MFLKPILLLACASSVLGFFEQTWFSTDHFVVTPSNAPFTSLDHGVNFFFQPDGNFVVYLHGTTTLADAVWSSTTVGS